MCKKEDQKEKLILLEQLVDDDLGNGKHIQKKLKAKLCKLGLSEKEFVKKLSQFKEKG